MTGDTLKAQEGKSRHPPHLEPAKPAGRLVDPILFVAICQLQLLELPAGSWLGRAGDAGIMPGDAGLSLPLERSWAGPHGWGNPSLRGGGRGLQASLPSGVSELFLARAAHVTCALHGRQSSLSVPLASSTRRDYHEKRKRRA